MSGAPPPAVSSDWAIAGGALGFSSLPAALVVFHAFTRPPMHREVDLLRVETLWPLALIVFLFGAAFGWAGASLLQRTRPEWGERHPRAAAFAAGYVAGATGFAVAVAGVGLLLFGVNAI